MKMKKFSVITPIIALLCISMFASFSTLQAKAQIVPLNPTYCISVYGTSPIGTGNVYNKNGFVGTAPSGNYAQIYGQYATDGGAAVLTMSGPVNAGSAITIHAEAASGYTSSLLYVYVSSSPTGPWYQTSPTSGGSPSPETISTTTALWWTFYGPSGVNFQYVSIAGYNANAPEDVFIDCVLTM
jgi:hypothetical protein